MVLRTKLECESSTVWIMFRVPLVYIFDLGKFGILQLWIHSLWSNASAVWISAEVLQIQGLWGWGGGAGKRGDPLEGVPSQRIAGTASFMWLSEVSSFDFLHYYFFFFLKRIGIIQRKKESLGTISIHSLELWL